MKLKRILEELEKDKDIAPLLTAVAVSSKDSDGKKLLHALIEIKRIAAVDHDQLPPKINKAIIENGQ